MSFRRTFVAGLRDRLAVETESPAVWRIRFYAAGLSILFGIFAVVLLLPMARGVVSWAAAPGSILMLAGGVLAIHVQRNSDVTTSRRAGMSAAILTIVGLIEVCAVLAST